MGTASSRVQPVLDEWLGILNGPFEGVISVLTSTLVDVIRARLATTSALSSERRQLASQYLER
jgi:hypothetical protein